MSSFVPLQRPALEYMSSTFGFVVPNPGPKAKPAEDAMRWRIVMGRSRGTSSPSFKTLRSANSGMNFVDGIVELPLTLFIEEQHCDGNDRFRHRRDAEDGVLPQRLTTFEG